MLPRSGDVLTITKDASVQFAEPILFRVIRVPDGTTYEGWIWLDGYELNAAGDAVERREVFVQIAGIRTVGDLLNRANNSATYATTTAVRPDAGRAGRLTPHQERRARDVRWETR